MTVCVAAICENGKAVVLAADKMMGMGYVEGEPDISKMRPLHKDWWVLFAGDDIPSVFDIIDYAKASLSEQGVAGADPASLAQIMNSVRKGFLKKRLEDAETLYLAPSGWDLERFNKEGHQLHPDAPQIRYNLDHYAMQIELLVAGFDKGDAYIFDLAGYGDKPGIPRRCDIPGFQAIGSGSVAANYMMYYRSAS